MRTLLILLIAASAWGYTTRIHTDTLQADSFSIMPKIFVSTSGKIDSINARTQHFYGMPSGTPGDSVTFLNNGNEVHCTKAQVITWLDSLRKSHLSDSSLNSHKADTAINGKRSVYADSSGNTHKADTSLTAKRSVYADSSGKAHADSARASHISDSAMAANHSYKLTVARTIGKSTTFDGTANIVPDSAVSVAQATQLTTARTIGNTSFNGTANIIPDTCNKANRARYADSSGNTHKADTSISSHQAAQLTTAANIGNVSFNGTAAIIPDTVNKANRARYADSTGKIPDTVHIAKGLSANNINVSNVQTSNLNGTAIGSAYSVVGADQAGAATAAVNAAVYGTPYYLPYFSGAHALGNSPVYTDGNGISLGTGTVNYLLNLYKASDIPHMDLSGDNGSGNNGGLIVSYGAGSATRQKAQLGIYNYIGYLTLLNGSGNTIVNIGQGLNFFKGDFVDSGNIGFGTSTLNYLLNAYSPSSNPHLDLSGDNGSGTNGGIIVSYDAGSVSRQKAQMGIYAYDGFLTLTKASGAVSANFGQGFNYLKNDFTDSGNTTVTGTVTSAVDSTQRLAVNGNADFYPNGNHLQLGYTSGQFFLDPGAYNLSLGAFTNNNRIIIGSDAAYCGQLNPSGVNIGGNDTVVGAVKFSTLSPSGIVTNDNSGNLSTATLSSLLSAGGVKSFGGSVLTNTATAGGLDNINCDIYNTFVWSPTPPGTYGQNLTVTISGSPPEGALLFVHGYQNITQGFLIGGRSFPAGPGGGVHGILIRNNASWHILSLSQE